MRHFLSLVLAIVLAPVLWGAMSYGVSYAAKGAIAAGTFDRDQLISIGLLIAAGLALAVLLSARISPIGPALAGVVYLAASAYFLTQGSSFTRLVNDVFSAQDTVTLLLLVRVGLFWMLGVALLVPLAVPSRWRRKVAAPAPAAAGGAGLPNVPANPYGSPPPGAPGAPHAQSGAPGWSAGPNAGSEPASAQPMPTTVEPAAQASPYDQTRQYGGNAAPGREGAGTPASSYQAEGGSEYPSAPGWDTPPRSAGSDQAYPPATYPATNAPYQSEPYQGQGYQGSAYQGNQYPSTPQQQPPSSQNQYPAPPQYPASSQYPPSTYPASTYPATYSAPGSSPSPSYGSSEEQAPANYGPTVYGRSREEPRTPAPAPYSNALPAGAPASDGPAPSPGDAAPAGDNPETDEAEVERHDATRKVYRPTMPPAWRPGEDPGQTRPVQ